MYTVVYPNVVRTALSDIKWLTILVRQHAAQFVDRHSERKAAGRRVKTEDYSALAIDAQTRAITS